MLFHNSACKNLAGRVAANGGEWGWGENGTITGNAAMWQDPGDGFGFCPTWGTLQVCISGSPAADLAFELQGTSR